MTTPTTDSFKPHVGISSVSMLDEMASSITTKGLISETHTAARSETQNAARHSTKNNNKKASSILIAVNSELAASKRNGSKTSALLQHMYDYTIVPSEKIQKRLDYFYLPYN